MTPESIRLFFQVAELESFTKAAAQRQTVQSHISKQIAEFESACGGRLFTRTGRGVVLTELGHHIATRHPHTQNIDSCFDSNLVASRSATWSTCQ